MLTELRNVLETLQGIIDSHDSSDCGARSIMSQIDFPFICHLSVQDEILNLIEKPNKSLQKADMMVDIVKKML